MFVRARALEWRAAVVMGIWRVPFPHTEIVIGLKL